MKENINEVKYFEINSLAKGPTVLIIAGVHGDEFEPIITAMRLKNELSGMIKRGKVLIINVANPSAYSMGTRLGNDGLDMARICPGNQDGSLSENAAFVVSEMIKTADYVIDMHTGGSLFEIFPLAGYMMHPDPVVLAAQRMMAKAFNLPVVWGTDATPNGRTLSIARDAGVPAIYVEYGGGGSLNKEIIPSYFQGCKRVLCALDLLDEKLDISNENLSYWVEDKAPDSGYLQGKMLSEFHGIFVSSVHNGDCIERGQEWGYVHDPINGEKHKALADTDGLVIFIRKSPKVKAGDSLGGILPLENNKISKK